MLRYLSIRDFVIVDRLELEFEPGFTVLTGETGAGKSILIDALALALGERGDPGVIRQGQKQAEISAEFDTPKELDAWLAEHELATEEGGCILRRVLDTGGRSRAFINGRAATLAQLREAGEYLIDIHGQHAHQSLTKGDAQRALVDEHAGLTAEVREVGTLYRRLRQLREALTEAQTNAKRLQEERDQVAWHVEELIKISPQEGEWDEVQREHTRLAHAASLIEGAQGAVEALVDDDDAILGRLAGIIAKLEDLVEYDEGLKNVIDALTPARIQVQEAAHELAQYLRRADLDPQRLAQVGGRLESLHGAARKFRIPPENLPAELVRLRERLAELKLSADLEALQREADAAQQAYLAAAKLLTDKRAKAAKALAKQVAGAMQTLAMAGGKFEIALQPLEEGNATGLERIEFLVAGHAGVEPRPLAKVASGGELSRISLAIQVITSRAAKVPTLIFDEVDAGIGGAVAEVVGKLLKQLGAERQVFCVTHLPQVASQGDIHWRVAKQESGGSTLSSVTPLAKTERVDEIARMLGGSEITATTRKAAKEMLAA
ncbi:MAG TPA: DNA repair protein RecN [Burkholderiales bacterium]|jgi:DNA repair protein RecN (Recombination protein N)|nr:DNA repair protein RecN [Burkholderiales bacterium]